MPDAWLYCDDRNATENLLATQLPHLRHERLETDFLAAVNNIDILDLVFPSGDLLDVLSGDLIGEEDARKSTLRSV